MTDYQPQSSLRNLPALLQKVSVMVVDPDPRISGIVRRVLHNLGFGEIHLESSYTEALEKFREHPADFIITDFDITPVKDGLSFVEYIRMSPESPNPHVPIIMLTGHTEHQEVEIARDLGITEFATKPFTARSLCDRIVRVVENPRSFIITKRYVGPDRRHRDKPPPPGGDRRGQYSAPLHSPATAATSLQNKTRTLFDKLLGKRHE